VCFGVVNHSASSPNSFVTQAWRTDPIAFGMASDIVLCAHDDVPGDTLE